MAIGIGLSALSARIDEISRIAVAQVAAPDTALGVAKTSAIAGAASVAAATGVMASKGDPASQLHHLHQQMDSGKKIV